MIVQAALEDLVYPPGEVVFVAIYDPQQQVYGVPDYIHGMESAMLNVDATRFRPQVLQRTAHILVISCIPLTRIWIPSSRRNSRKKIRGVKRGGQF